MATARRAVLCDGKGKALSSAKQLWTGSSSYCHFGDGKKKWPSRIVRQTTAQVWRIYERSGWRCACLMRNFEVFWLQCLLVTYCFDMPLRASFSVGQEEHSLLAS